ncbi:MAG: triose-phosphate isomerase [Bdellovibrionia bacterium]
MIYAANWKLHKTPEQAQNFLRELSQSYKPHHNDKVVIFPPALLAGVFSQELQNSTMGWGLQNSYSQEQGAFTGENSAGTAKVMGAQYVLVGHSERRSLFAERDELLAEKVKLAQSLGLQVVFCIGETLEQREKNQTRSVLIEQIRKGLKSAQAKNLIVAYEPVWAIGTGKVATPEQVAETHTWIAQILKDHSLDLVPILYGGSVKPDNAAVLKQQAHVAGFLVGGASLEVSSFLGIIKA